MKFLKKVGIYVAIGFIFGAIIALFIFRILRNRNQPGGSAIIDKHIDDISGGIAEAQQLNEDAQELAGDAKKEIDDSLDINQQIRNELAGTGEGIDRLTKASNQLAELMERLQKKAKET